MKICINRTNSSYSFFISIADFTTTAHRNKTELLFTQPCQSQSYINYTRNRYYYVNTWFHMKICINSTNRSFSCRYNVDFTTTSQHTKSELLFTQSDQSQSSIYNTWSGYYYDTHDSIWKFVSTAQIVRFHVTTPVIVLRIQEMQYQNCISRFHINQNHI